MSLQGTISHLDAPQRGRRRSSAPVDDRARSFAKARRHTVLVKLLRVILPMITVAALASYGIGMRAKIRTSGGGKLDTGAISISTQNLTMSNPRYEGFNKDGSKFNVTAKTATQDIRQQGPIDLTTIEGHLYQLSNNTIKLTAPRGKFDNKSNELELFDDIKIRGDDGLRADLTHAMIYIKDNRIVSKQPVAIDMTAGQIRANEMELLQARKQAIFSDGVATRLRPEPKPQAAAAAAPTAGRTATAPPPRMIGASDSPVDVRSRKLEVDDNKKTAIFTGDVEAKQGEAILRSPALHAFYDGAPIAPPGTQPAAPGAAAAPAGKLKRLFVPSDVHLTQGNDVVTSDTADFDALRETAALVGKVEMKSGADRQATADRADIDSKNDTILLTGAVVVTQDRNILKGSRLFVDRKNGTTNLSTPVEPGQPPGRISTRLYQGPAPTPGAAAKAAAVKAAQPAADAGGFVFRTDPNAPIDIDAETLDVVDKAKTATYRGAVHAVQGEFTIKTPEMIATYSGETGIGLPGAAQGAKQQTAQLQRVRAVQKVEVTSTNGQSAIGDWADMDVKGNTVTIGVSTPGGHVTLKKGASISYAPKVVIDMTTGLTHLENFIKPGGPAVSQSPTEQRAPYVLPDLPAKKTPVTAPVAPTFDTDPTKCTRAVCIKIDPKDGVGVQSGAKPGAATPPAAAGKGSDLPWQTEPAAPSKKKAPARETSGWTSSPSP